ncbi:TPA: hypothetical protein ACH3X1_007019 [Trebouxia sp. C0004]
MFNAGALDVCRGKRAAKCQAQAEGSVARLAVKNTKNVDPEQHDLLIEDLGWRSVFSEGDDRTRQLLADILEALFGMKCTPNMVAKYKCYTPGSFGIQQRVGWRQGSGESVRSWHDE